MTRQDQKKDLIGRKFCYKMREDEDYFNMEASFDSAPENLLHQNAMKGSVPLNNAASSGSSNVNSNSSSIINPLTNNEGVSQKPEPKGKVQD